MTESCQVTYRASEYDISILNKHRKSVGEMIGVENPSNGAVSKWLTHAADQHITNPDPSTQTLLEHLMNKDPNKKTLIELGIEAIKTKKEK